jgi:hypothetical protein
MTVPQEIVRWRKASASGSQGACVELAHTGSAVRDSKNVAGPILKADAAALVKAVKMGALDR